MANLKVAASNNNKNLTANKATPAAQQYMKNTGQTILGVPTNVKAKGTIPNDVF
jgi:hypothetical protein